MSIITAMPGTLGSSYESEPHVIHNGERCINCRRSIPGTRTYTGEQPEQFIPGIEYILGEATCPNCKMPAHRLITIV